MLITEFLEARIAEDEAVARAATPGPWEWDDEQAEDESFLYDPDKRAVLFGYGMHSQGFLECSSEDRAHIARYDPARVLAECAAKRAIIKEWEDPASLQDYDREGAFYASAITQALECLAAVYADHPDYLPEWKP